MTEILLIRHAQSNHYIKDEYNRTLTEKGIEDSKKLPESLKNYSLDAIFCSPYIRAIQTITPIAKARQMDIIIKHDLSERMTNSDWINDEKKLDTFIRKMWKDITISVDGGESVKQLQERNIKVMNMILNNYTSKCVMIGTHGTALASMIHYYNRDFSAEDFLKFVNKNPYIVKLKFTKTRFIEIQEINF